MAGRPAVFISYKRDHDASLALAIQLEAALTERFEVWRDVDIRPGDRWSDELWRWLMDCSAAIALVSNEATTSDWCRREWSVLAARASHDGLPVIPVRVDGAGRGDDILGHLQAIAGDDPALQVAATLRHLRAAPPSPTAFLAAHQAWLRWQYEEAPALGGLPFALGDVYVDTECGALTWEKISRDRTIDPFDEVAGGRHDLLGAVLGYFGDPNFHDLVVVQGPAGSGKSAFTLRLAHRLMAEGLRPVLVRFRDLRLSTYVDLDAQLEDAIRLAPAGESAPRPRAPVFGDDILDEEARLGKATISRTVLLLDGWDEVDLTGNVDFRDQIEAWLPRVRQRFTDRRGRPPVRLLLTGRPSTVVDRSQLLRRPTPVLTVRPLRPDQLRRYASRISGRLASAAAATWQLDVTRCERAFASYDRWFQRRTHEGADVLGSPLLALLAFRTLADWPGATDALFARSTALYRALIDVTVAHAGKAEGSPEGTVHRGGVELRRLLQRVATVITHRGGESVSAEELRLRLEGDPALEAWAAGSAGESALHELVVNFYFKSHPELGCEFLHKSFREYLYAEHIVQALADATEGRSGALDRPGTDAHRDFPEGTLHHRASRTIARLLSAQWLTTEVRTHTFWLMERAAAANAARWVAVRDLLADVFGWWAERTHLRMHTTRHRGQPVFRPPPIAEILEAAAPLDNPNLTSSHSTARADAVLGHALLQLCAFAHGLLLDRTGGPERTRQSRDAGQLRFRPFADAARSAVARLTRQDGATWGGLAGTHLGPVDLDGLDLAGARLAGTNLAGASLRATDLTGADLGQADLTGADVRRAILLRASLTGADLTGALLDEADLRCAYLVVADLYGADLTGADLGRADLSGADLPTADLIGAHLAEAWLFDANLSSARLTGANLRRADLTRADLTDANLHRADLSGANLFRADLTGTDFTEADLAGAHLRSARLTNTTLEGARLTGACLVHAVLTRTRLDGADTEGADLGGVAFLDG